MPDADQDEKLIDAKLEEINLLLEELQRRRKELQEAKEAVTMQQRLQQQQQLKTLPQAPAAVEKRTPGRRADANLEGILRSLNWTSFKKKDGEWTFLRDREGRLREELDSAREFVDQLRKGKDVVVGKYRYTLSEDKFLNRYVATA